MAMRSPRSSVAIGGLLCCGLLGIVGLIFGVVAMRETKRTGQDGYGLALAGAIIGGLTLAGYVDRRGALPRAHVQRLAVDLVR